MTKEQKIPGKKHTRKRIGVQNLEHSFSENSFESWWSASYTFQIRMSSAQNGVLLLMSATCAVQNPSPSRKAIGQLEQI